MANNGRVLVLLAAALLLAAGCRSLREIDVGGADGGGEGDVDSDSDSDSDADSDSDGDTDTDTASDTGTDTDLLPCVYNCVDPMWGCGERGRYIHDEMYCPNEGEVCCQGWKYQDVWPCLICSEPFPAHSTAPVDLSIMQ